MNCKGISALLIKTMQVSNARTLPNLVWCTSTLNTNQEQYGFQC